MNYLIDTNVISELAKRRPDDSVLQWFAEINAHQLYISVLTLGELRKGIDLVKDTAKRKQLNAWIKSDVQDWFQDRILDITSDIAETWGTLLAQTKRTVNAIDTLIAATAIHHQLTVLTRNIQDFQFTELSVINPWASARRSY